MKVAVLGASGLVGREMLKVMAERNFPFDELRLLSGKGSAGKTCTYQGKEYTYEEAADSSFEGMDIVLGAAENAVAQRFAPAIKKAGAVFIDNSSAFRLDDDVPLVVPEINPEDAFKHSGIIANPNCVTIIAAVAVGGIAKLSPIKTMTASSYQAVSGAGRAGLYELEEQVKQYAAGEELTVDAFPCQIAFNLIPKIGNITDNGYSKEEMKLQNEGRKILHMPDMKVSCTCVRVPVLRSHSISINLLTEEKICVEEARKAIAAFPGTVVLDDAANDQFPTPLLTSDQDLVYVGRIREDLTNGGIALWCCGDQIRKGAATNAVQIAELLLNK
ncbi:MAG: aspartate-semialdehyde dehydrogenase [Firmicutes bacterium]|nr:aspartate-semialdehyde dehydrogenase [Bacillota bacterium]